MDFSRALMEGRRGLRDIEIHTEDCVICVSMDRFRFFLVFFWYLDFTFLDVTPAWGYKLFILYL